MSDTQKKSRLTSDGIIKKRKRGPRDYRAENARRSNSLRNIEFPDVAISRDMHWKRKTIERILDSGILAAESVAEVRRRMRTGNAGSGSLPDGTVQPLLSINAAFKMLRGFEAKALMGLVSHE